MKDAAKKFNVARLRQVEVLLINVLSIRRSGDQVTVAQTRVRSGDTPVVFSGMLRRRDPASL
jgi:hypothetical protein